MKRSTLGGASSARAQTYADAIALNGARAAAAIVRPTVDALLALIMAATSPEDCHRRLIEFYRQAPPPRELQRVIASGLVVAKLAGLAAHAEAILEIDSTLVTAPKRLSAVTRHALAKVLDVATVDVALPEVTT